MLSETTLEILRYFSRGELERLQMHSRFLRDFVDSSSSVLPLRPFFVVRAGIGRGVRIQQERGNYNEDSLFEVSTLTEASLGPLCNRVNNAFVERMLITFTRFLDDARFLRHLRDHVAELKCRANFLDVRNSFDSANFDDELVYFVATRLKPQTLICSIQRAQQASQAMLFNHASMRSVLKHAEVYELSQLATEASTGVEVNQDAVLSVVSKHMTKKWDPLIALTNGTTVHRPCTEFTIVLLLSTS